VTAVRLPFGHAIAGKYTLGNLLGYGGASASYAATTTAGRSVVLKLFSPQLADRSDVLLALQRAAGVTNALPAEVTTPILDVGFDPQTRSPYMVTQSMALPSLFELVRAAPLQPLDVAQVLRGIALSVDVAHAQGLAHGGLKPQNVFVGDGPAQRQVKVIDFGVSAAREALPTNEGWHCAAPWLAPEQVTGGCSAGADIFSAALVAFFAATGRSYFRSCEGRVPNLDAWQAELEGPRLSACVRAREMGVGLPPQWDAVFARALSPDPAQRFASVADLARALLGDAGTSLSSPERGSRRPPPAVASSGPPPGLEPRSRSGLIATLVVVLLFAVAGAGGVLIMRRRAHPVQMATNAPGAASMPASTSTALPDVVPSSAVPDASSFANAEPPDAAQDVQAAPLDNDASIPQTAELTVLCVPACDTMTVDDAVLDAGLSDPMPLAPGTHTIVAAKATFLPQTRKVILKPGQPQKVTLVLLRPGPPPPKPCGKFLERCP
jgi:serine/threonine protein kinase